MLQQLPELSSGYLLVSNQLLPAGGHHEAHHRNSKTNQDVPVANVKRRCCSQWELSAGHVVSDDPDKPNNHEAKHHRLKPNWV